MSYLKIKKKMDNMVKKMASLENSQAKHDLFMAYYNLVGQTQTEKPSIILQKLERFEKLYIDKME